MNKLHYLFIRDLCSTRTRTLWILIVNLMLLLLPRSIYAQNTYETTMERAASYRIANNFIAAESLYDSILIKNPNDVDALVGRGFCRLNNRYMLPKAIVDFEKVIAITPEYVDAYIGKATAQSRTGDFAAAIQTLENCLIVCKNDTGKLQYLSEGCWRLEHFRLARYIDRTTPPKAGRNLVATPNIISYYVTWSSLTNGATWLFHGVTYVRTIRPDFTISLQSEYFTRNADGDFSGGASFNYRASKRLTFSYDGYFSDVKGFVANQRHKPKATFFILPFTSVATGADLSHYASGWARFARIELEQYTERLIARYTLLGGIDNNDQTVFSHILAFNAETSNRLHLGLGASYGHESVEGFGPSYVASLVTSLFVNTKVFLSHHLAIQSTIAGEWREQKYFRTV
ncbi:MAG TPA: hypothetical protein VKO63_03775, partial [Chitinispirillaceae bacterium]|nr:hypothetical protein [Chitinispirillaceae bacterium]